MSAFQRTCAAGCDRPALPRELTRGDEKCRAQVYPETSESRSKECKSLDVPMLPCGCDYHIQGNHTLPLDEHTERAIHCGCKP